MSRRLLLLGLPVDLLPRAEAVEAAAQLVRAGGPHHVVALNPLKLLLARDDPGLAASIRGAALVLVDGAGIAWALRRIHGARPEIVPGCELMEELLRRAPREGWSVYFAGASGAVLERMRKCAAERCPGLAIAGAEQGFFAPGEEEAAARRVVAARPHLLFVGMGAGRQERFIERVRALGGVPLMLGVGGSFDAYTGALPRPPRAVRALRMEWLWRALRQPSRIPRLFRLPRFVALVLRAPRAVSPDPGTMPRPCGKPPS